MLNMKDTGRKRLYYIITPPPTALPKAPVRDKKTAKERKELIRNIIAKKLAGSISLDGLALAPKTSNQMDASTTHRAALSP